MKHKLPFNTERYVTAVYDQETGKLECWRVSVDLMPDHISGLRVGRKVVVTIDIPKQHKKTVRR